MLDCIDFDARRTNDVYDLIRTDAPAQLFPLGSESDTGDPADYGNEINADMAYGDYLYKTENEIS